MSTLFTFFLLLPENFKLPGALHCQFVSIHYIPESCALFFQIPAGRLFSENSVLMFLKIPFPEWSL